MRLNIIGSEGYLGTVLKAVFPQEIPRRDFDLTLGHDVRKLNPLEFAGEAVLYLASYHETSDDSAENEARYRELMVDTPLAIAQYAEYFFYVSSMRALTDRHRLYGRTKLEAERALLVSTQGRTILRIGTLWGGFDVPDRSKFPESSMNFALKYGKFEGNHWESFTTHIVEACEFIGTTLIDAVTRYRPTRRVVTLTDTMTLMTADEVRALLDGRHPDGHLQTKFHYEQQCLVENPWGAQEVVKK